MNTDTLLWTSVLMLMIIAVVHAALTLFTVVAIRSLHGTSKEHDAALDEHDTMLDALARSIEVLTRRCDIAARRHCQQRLKAERKAQKGLICKHP